MQVLSLPMHRTAEKGQIQGFATQNNGTQDSHLQFVDCFHYWYFTITSSDFRRYHSYIQHVFRAKGNFLQKDFFYIWADGYQLGCKHFKLWSGYTANSVSLVYIWEATMAEKSFEIKFYQMCNRYCATGILSKTARLTLIRNVLSNLSI